MIWTLRPTEALLFSSWASNLKRMTTYYRLTLYLCSTETIYDIKTLVKPRLSAALSRRPKKQSCFSASLRPRCDRIAALWRWIWSIRSINTDYSNPGGQGEGSGPRRVHTSKHVRAATASLWAVFLFKHSIIYQIFRCKFTFIPPSSSFNPEDPFSRKGNEHLRVCCC